MPGHPGRHDLSVSRGIDKMIQSCRYIKQGHEVKKKIMHALNVIDLTLVGIVKE
jgi:hypothetical protein